LTELEKIGNRKLYTERDTGQISDQGRSNRLAGTSSRIKKKKTKESAPVQCIPPEGGRPRCRQLSHCHKTEKPMKQKCRWRGAGNVAFAMACVHLSGSPVLSQTALTRQTLGGGREDGRGSVKGHGWGGGAILNCLDDLGSTLDSGGHGIPRFALASLSRSRLAVQSECVP